ncbi:MAG: sulfatase-like hydrolase/transferase [Planctomycetota bacterium]
MTRKAIASLLLSVTILAGFADADEQPNLILIIADDLGYGETSMMGCPDIPTPHIDALADRGVRCTSGYVTSSYCSPSRAGMLTGRYQSRFGYDHNPVGDKNLLETAGVPDSELLFAEPLVEAGYQTALIGKWHLGATPSKHPNQRGFKEFWGFLHEGHYYVPGPPYDEVWTMLRDRSLEKGQRTIDGKNVRGNYAPINEPLYDKHNPVLNETVTVETFDYLTDEITSRSVDFVERHHQSPFALVVSYNAVHSPMQARLDDVESFSHISDIQRRIFAGMTVALDRGVGEITRCLEKHNLRENTLLVFVSDNGGPTKELTSRNTPLRGEKGSVYEGGLRVPMIWSMPSRLPTGVSEDRPVLSLDVVATFAEMAGVSSAFEELDGVNLDGWLGRPNNAAPNRPIFWRMTHGKRAIRVGNYKWIQPRRGVEPELYDLESDIGESVNLAKDRPDVIFQLSEVWSAINEMMAPPML